MSFFPVFVMDSLSAGKLRSAQKRANSFEIKLKCPIIDRTKMFCLSLQQGNISDCISFACVLKRVPDRLIQECHLFFIFAAPLN